MKALVVVDMQNDFASPHGALFVPGAPEIISPVIAQILKSPGPIVLTMDAHEEKDPSFKDYGGQWPKHCVRGAWGFELHQALTHGVSSSMADLVIRKASNSAFFHEGMPTGLHGYLRDNWVDSLDIIGLALDYCVGETALDAAKLGYEVTVYRDCTRAVTFDSGVEMITRLKSEGVRVV